MTKVPFVLLALVPAVALGALKPEPAVAPVEMFGASVDLKPGLKVGVSNDSNFYTEPAGREDDTDIYRVTPSLTARVGDDAEFTEFALSATGGWVSVDGADDFTDYNAAYAGKYAPAGNLSITTSVGTSQGHDERGTGNTNDCTNNLPLLTMTLCPGEPNTFQDVNGNFSMMLGSSESRGRVTLGLDAMGRRYTNNGVSTGALEYDNLGTSFKFAWQVGGKTDAVFETKLTDTDYLTGGASGDSTDLEYLLGVEWDVSGKTTGYAKAGLQEKDFADATTGDLSEPAWRLGVTWTPSEQGLINLEMAKSIQESTVPLSTSKDVTDWNLSARHLFNERVEPYITLSNETTDYQGIARSDDATTVGLGVDYKFRRWIVFGAAWSRTEETSNVGLGLRDFERDVISLTADMTL